jgi:hypothetical protein
MFRVDCLFLPLRVILIVDNKICMIVLFYEYIKWLTSNENHSVSFNQQREPSHEITKRNISVQ